MLRSRFLWQLCGALGATILVSTIVFGSLATSQVQTDARNNIRESLRTQAAILRQLLKPNLLNDTPISSDELIDITGGADNRITLIDAAGVVIADNREEPALMNNHLDRPEVIAARTQDFGVSERFSETIQQNMLYVALRVEGEQELLGFIRVAVPLRVVEHQLAALRNQILVSGTVIAAVFLVIAFLLARQFTIPISSMTDSAARIAQGDYDLRLNEDRNDEIGRLSRALNELARGTQERIGALTSSRNQLAAILSGLTEGVIAVDLEQTILHINDSARSMLRLGSRDVVNRSLWEVVLVTEICQAVDTCLSELITVNATVKVDKKTLDVSVVLLRDHDWTSAAGAIIVLQDITEMLRLEQVRSDFVANASHELKTPISAIRGFAETILDDPNIPEEVLDRFLRRIRSQAARLDHIVQDLIHLSRFDTHARKMSVSRIDLAWLLRDVYRAKSEDATDAGVTLKVDVPDKPVEVEGEQEALDQMVTNLVDNAIKYTQADGRVSLRLRTLGRMAVIEVEDTGIGIPEEEQQRIFERFYRVDRARSREQGGTGLGLAIVKHIAQSHRGSVTVTSQPNKGSVFTVRLPMVS
ncbi:MAG: ATP-binding protein [Pseudomonadota bacterium]